MTANERHIEEAGKLVDEWLSEQEGYAIRAERMPEGSRDWLVTACAIGLASGERRGMERAAEIAADLADDEAFLDEKGRFGAELAAASIRAELEPDALTISETRKD